MNENIVEQAALGWFEALGYDTARGADISPGADYPPDAQESATKLVIRQAELMAENKVT
jgi:hypothetical protein